MTTQSAKEERTMTRYLLGAATEEECVKVEERFLRDAEYLDQLRAMECEIIDDYVGGGMTAAIRRSFERRALASPQGREQVARARKFHAQLDLIAAEGREPAPLISVPRESLREKLGARLFTTASVLRYGMAAAALLFLLGGMWLLREESLSRRRIAELAAERDLARRSEKDLQERLAAQRSERQQLTSQLENESRRLAAERSRNDRMQREIRESQSGSSPSTTPNGDFVELALASGIERNPGEPRKLRIPMRVRMVKLQLELDPSVNNRGYLVELNTAAGAQVWLQGELTAQQTDWGRFVTLMIPTRALPAGEYELILRGSTNDRKGEVVGYYYFIASPSDARKR
ncbi:MAG TPA: hypothetical protein VFV58_28095 [Blastocatellia bacterium]|jgi:hypothetical protein|nr:hypothetical protein [Blastocatellia bacterium]